MKNLLIILAVLLAACSPSSGKDYVAQYQCGPNDIALNSLALFKDGTFHLMTRGIDLDSGTMINGPIYRGHYTEGPNTYDLFFKNVAVERIKSLFNQTQGDGFIEGSGAYRMNKEPDSLYIDGCLMHKAI